MSAPTPGSREWLDSVREEPLEPDRPIIDPHHHLWREPRAGSSYLLDDLWVDTSAGHKIEKTVFLECRASYRESGAEHLKPVGETEFVTEIAEQSRTSPGQTEIAAIVAHADLTRGEAVEEVLLAHEEAARGLFRGIRHAGACDPHPEALSIPGRAPAGLYASEDFRRGLRTLNRMGHSYDTWHYHHQMAEFIDLARAVPEATLVLDHFGTPLGVGPYEGQREEIFGQWRADLAELSRCDNVVAKLGGLAMPDNGFGWNLARRPPTSDEFVTAQRRYYEHTIECFGPQRCMFESNFPVDRRSISYPVLWNGLKKIAAQYTQAERHAMFYGTAARIYRL